MHPRSSNREEHIHAAIVYAEELCREAELRGFTGMDMVVSVAGTFAARNATLAGKVLVAVMDAVRAQPITKVVPTTH